jgi:hypothetical protein
MTDLGMPETRYALSGDINIAYQTIGHGPLDIVIVPGSISHVEFHHELPDLRHSCTGYPGSHAL